jgi:FkbM family methyltransferase
MDERCAYSVSVPGYDKVVAMKLAHSVFNTFLDVMEIGPGFPLRHISAWLGLEMHRAQIPGYGTVYLRNRHTDAQTFRQIFTRKQYWIPDSHGQRVHRAYDEIRAAGRTPLIVDAGANVGAASIWFALQFPEARVIAIEPEPGNAEMCRKNVAKASNVEVIEGAIGATSGYVTLSPPETPSWAFQTKREVEAPTRGAVPILTIPELLASTPDQDLLIAKVDIEGFEADLFSTNTDWLDSTKVLMIELHDWLLPGAHTSNSFQKAALGRGFELIISGENLLLVKC